MRFLRLALRDVGVAPLLRRRRQIDDRHLPLKKLVVEGAGIGDLVLHLGDARRGRPAGRPCRPSPASAATVRAGRQMNLPLRIFSAARMAFSASIFAVAFSTSATMPPMPRMRPAMGAGSKSSNASSFSPVPISLIGLPVTARIDSAAPPRPSPSTRVSTMPVEPDALVEAAGEIDGVLAGQRVGDQQHFVRRWRRGAPRPPRSSSPRRG